MSERTPVSLPARSILAPVIVAAPTSLRRPPTVGQLAVAVYAYADATGVDAGALWAMATTSVEDAWSMMAFARAQVLANASRTPSKKLGIVRAYEESITAASKADVRAKTQMLEIPQSTETSLSSREKKVVMEAMIETFGVPEEWPMAVSLRTIVGQGYSLAKAMLDNLLTGVRAEAYKEAMATAVASPAPAAPPVEETEPKVEEVKKPSSRRGKKSA